MLPSPHPIFLSSSGKEKVVIRVVANVALRPLEGAVDTVSNPKSWYSPVPPRGEQAEAGSASFSRSALTLATPV